MTKYSPPSSCRWQFSCLTMIPRSIVVGLKLLVIVNQSLTIVSLTCWYYILYSELFHCSWFFLVCSLRGKCKGRCSFDQLPGQWIAMGKIRMPVILIMTDDNQSKIFTWMTRDWFERRIPPLPLVFGCSRSSWFWFWSWSSFFLSFFDDHPAAHCSPYDTTPDVWRWGLKQSNTQSRHRPPPGSCMIWSSATLSFLLNLYFIGIQRASKRKGQPWLVHHMNVPMILDLTTTTTCWWATGEQQEQQEQHLVGEQQENSPCFREYLCCKPGKKSSAYRRHALHFIILSIFPLLYRLTII